MPRALFFNLWGNICPFFIIDIIFHLIGTIIIVVWKSKAENAVIIGGTNTSMDVYSKGIRIPPLLPRESPVYFKIFFDYLSSLHSSGIIYTGWSLKKRSCFRGFNLPWKYLSFSKENVDLRRKVRKREG